MSEIEKIERYIKRTKMSTKDHVRYSMNMLEAAELAYQARANRFPIEIISLAFAYGQAKGYRAAKAKKKGAIA